MTELHDPAQWTRRSMLGAGVLGGAMAAGSWARAANARPALLPPAPPAERRVGIAYSLWHITARWNAMPPPSRPWGQPLLGFYRSNDPRVLTQHAEWLSDAAVDFVFLGWSNNIGMDIRHPGGPKSQRFIESATLTLFKVWAQLPRSPRVAIMIGTPGDRHAIPDGALSAKADEVYDLFVANPARAPLLQHYLGKPLLIVYVNTPSQWQHGLPPWSDDRFTVRFMTGFLTQQPSLLSPGRISRYGYWSWEDRGRPTYSVFDGHPECMTVVAAWRGAHSPGRDKGQTYIRNWEYARRIGPRFVLAGTFNEWWVSEQINAAHSKDVEPSVQFGWRTMDILKHQATLFKQGK